MVIEQLKLHTFTYIFIFDKQIGLKFKENGNMKNI